MRITVITGVSRGLGAALFSVAYAAGDRVVALGRRFTDEQRRLAGQRPDRVVLVETDLAEPATWPDADRLRAAYGSVGAGAHLVLLHNAAVVGPIGAVGTLPRDEIARSVTVNLSAPIGLTDAFLASAPADAARLTVLFVSSGAVAAPKEGWSVYSATKRAGETFIEVLAAESARRDPRIRALAFNPGVMDTGMQADLRGADFPDRQRFVDRHERGELVDPAEIAERIFVERLTGE